jgi:hypothetical protein
MDAIDVSCPKPVPAKAYGRNIRYVAAADAQRAEVGDFTTALECVML